MDALSLLTNISYVLDICLPKFPPSIGTINLNIGYFFKHGPNSFVVGYYLFIILCVLLHEFIKADMIHLFPQNKIPIQVF